MELVGRITKDAVVHQLKNERKVVNFSIAVNDYYKPKDGEGVKICTYVNCSYWINTKIAAQLKKGSLIEISGRIYVNAYKGADGEAKASTNCHVNGIKIHLFGKSENGFNGANSENALQKKEVVDDFTILKKPARYKFVTSRFTVFQK